MNNNMSIIVSPANNSTDTNVIHKGQTVNFINILSGVHVANEVPKKIQYTDTDNLENVTALLNYVVIKTNEHSYSSQQGFAPMHSSQSQTADLFRREVTTKIENGVEVVDRRLTPLKLVGENIQDFTFYDFNVSNNRTYQYVLYPTIDGDDVDREEVIVHTNWQAWSITELHSTGKGNNSYYATANDVWLFNLNVDTGEQTQNLTRNEVQTLGAYPRYSQGRQNYISGTVSCLMGSDVLPANYLNGKMEGGYTEKRLFDVNPTSNERIDMLNAWRALVFSKNPKLLKDRKGQAFLVTLTQSSNKPYDAVRRQPDTISFSWTQIGSLDEVTILSSK